MQQPPACRARRFVFALLWAAVVVGEVSASTVSATPSPAPPASPASAATLERTGAQTGDLDADGLAGAADPCARDARNTCFGAVAVERASGKPLRINAGHHDRLPCAQPTRDCSDALWLRDFGHRGESRLAGCPHRRGSAQTCVLRGVAAALGCEDFLTRRLFRCGRRPAGKRGELRYVFDVAPGSYLVNLFFAASPPRPPDRKGAVGATLAVNGRAAYERFDPSDVMSTAGGAVVRSVLIDVAGDAGLEIELRNAGRRTAVRAIEVLVRTQPSSR